MEWVIGRIQSKFVLTRISTELRSKRVSNPVRQLSDVMQFVALHKCLHTSNAFPFTLTFFVFFFRPSFPSSMYLQLIGVYVEDRVTQLLRHIRLEHMAMFSILSCTGTFDIPSMYAHLDYNLRQIHVKYTYHLSGIISINVKRRI